MHLALVVNDLKTYGLLRDHLWVISPPGKRGVVKVHVLLQKPKTSEQELVFGYALTRLGLTTPEAARLQYPEELEIGWSDDATPDIT